MDFWRGRLVVCCFSLEVDTDRLSRNVGKQTTNLRRVKSQKIEGLKKQAVNVLL
jgi:hypothetical protein